MKTAWAAIRRAGRALRNGTPPTLLGWLVAALSVAAFWFEGVGALDLVVFIMGIAGMVLFALTTLSSGIAGLVLRWRLRPPDGGALTLEGGSRMRTGFDAPSLGWLPFLTLTWEWIEPRGVAVTPRLAGGRLQEEVRAAQRCRRETLTRRFSVGDVFGLSRVSWQRTVPMLVTVLPEVGRLRNMPVVQSVAGGEEQPHPSGSPEGDRMDIRRYSPRDSMRDIVWKMYARNRQLNVRTRERAVSSARKTVAYLLAGAGDEPAAAAARVAIETGSLGRTWVFAADGTPEPTSDHALALQAIARSGSIEPGTPPGLLSFLDRTQDNGGAHCIVFAPARDGPWTATILDAARKHAGRVSVVLGTDGVAHTSAVPLWKRLLLQPDPPVGIPSAELSRVMKKMAGAGANTLVVDRLSGRPYTQLQARVMG